MQRPRVGEQEDSSGGPAATYRVARLRSRSGQALVAELRRAKDVSGLSYTQLQALTPYSRSALERYINGKMFPPRLAVQGIARACAADPESLLQLWDLTTDAPAEEYASQKTPGNSSEPTSGLRNPISASALSTAHPARRARLDRSPFRNDLDATVRPTRTAITRHAEALWLHTTPPEEPESADPPRSSQARLAVIVAAALAAILVTLFEVLGDTPIRATFASPTPTPPSAVLPTSDLQPGEWERRLTAAAANDGTGNGRLDAIVIWRGPGPYDGRIYGIVHGLPADSDACLVARAAYDTGTRTIARTCGAASTAEIKSFFRYTWRADVQICVERFSSSNLQCSRWS